MQDLKTIRDITNYSDLLAARAFVSLFSAQCMDIDGQNSRTNSELRRYKAKPDVDLKMLDSREKAVIESAMVFRPLKDIITHAGSLIRMNTPGTDQPVKDVDLPIIESFRKMIDDALAFQPPVSLCSV